MSEFCKIVLLAYLGEKVVANMGNKGKYPKVREALDFCWKWIERKDADEGKIYEFLDDEDEDDLLNYILSASEEKERKEYGIILGVVSYISLNILITNKLPIPQFLSGVDDNYYDLIISDVIHLNIVNCMKKDMELVIKYCEDKIAINDFVVKKSEIMNLK